MLVCVCVCASVYQAWVCIALSDLTCWAVLIQVHFFRSTPATTSSDADLAFGRPGKAFGRPHAGPPQGDHTRGSAGHRPAAHGPHPAAPRASPHSHSGDQGPRPLLQSPPPRHPDVTHDLFEALKVVFPDASQESKIQEVLTNHPADTDLNKLVNYCIGALNV